MRARGHSGRPAEARGLTTLVDRGIDRRREAEQQRLDAAATQAKERWASLLGKAWHSYLAACQAKWSERCRREHKKLAQPGTYKGLVPADACTSQVVLGCGAGTAHEELAELQWAHVDFTWRSLTLRDKVAGRRVITLIPYLAAAAPQRVVRRA
jgi:hypothetical protein